MTNKNDEAFLKSIIGALPIKKNNTIKKPNVKTKLSKKINIKNQHDIDKSTLSTKTKLNNQSFYKLEKTTLNKKLKKGKIPIDLKIDFHGLSVFDAEELFFKTIVDCYKKNLRCLLFVTGKGALKKNNDQHDSIKLYYGKIRNSFFSWTTKKNIQKYILSVEQASIDYGADGAFFVYLRKQKF